uniref:ADAMTS-like 3 n=1 Tax=Esox lucius TaxID=8010 RepID=A0A3P8ZCQ7_ESOLU
MLDCVHVPSLRGSLCKVYYLTCFSLSQASRMTRSDEDGDSGWDAWGTWSDCSRTCGGGASYSLRRCLNGGNCEGKNIRYRTCSNLDCPIEAGDFRTQQCSAHNDIRYQGVAYEWVPVPYDPSAPCALRCQARGLSLTVELAPKVLDGTRCRADALDMCISGVCQEVGCDRQLGSGTREDSCGVCAGDGSTCRLVRGQALPHISPEEPVKTVLEVPMGSRSLRVSAKGPDLISKYNTSLQGLREEHSLVSPGSYLIGNTTVDYQRGTDRQTLRTQGPLKADFFIKVKYAFNPISSSQVLPEHHCNSYPENTKPTPKLKECNMDPCPESDGFKEVMPYDHFQPLPRWEQGPWTECSVSCGESAGLQERSVVCVEDDAHGQITQVDEWKCTHSPRPITQQSCNSFTCPQWVAMEWSQCTVTCGRGLRYRVVLCIDHRGQHTGGCKAPLKPHIKEDCLVPVACHKPRESVPVEAKLPWLKQAQELEEQRTATEEPTFIPGPWSPCSATCGPGVQTRELKCRVLLSFTQTEVDLPEDECGNNRPQLERPCDLGHCTVGPGFSPGLPDPPGPGLHTRGAEPHHWDYRGFTTCSASCAAGEQTAEVRCVSRERGEEVSESLCDPFSRPPAMARVCNPEPCPPRSASNTSHYPLPPGLARPVFTFHSDECREFKPSILQPCNQLDCPPAWETEQWQECSHSCGGGVQVRKVFCKQLLSTGAYRRLGDAGCPGVKPASQRTCSKTDCLPYMAGAEWGKCSVSCGLGIQRRETVCQRLTSTGQQVTLARWHCDGLPSPPLIRTWKEATIKETFQEPVKRCPLILGLRRIYIQTRQEKRLHLTVGGRAYLLPKTSLVIKCPVRHFQKASIRWEKDGRPLPSSKRMGLTKSGSLKVHSLGAGDSGVYVCIAGPAFDTFTLKLIGSDSRLIDRPVENESDPETEPDPTRVQPLHNPQNWDFQDLPRCLPLTSTLRGPSLSFLPFGGTETSVLQMQAGASGQQSSNLEERVRNVKFAWRLGDWTACSASCGGRGTRTRRVRCVTLEGREVLPSMCHHLPRPASAQLACNLHDCPPSWVASVWSKCSTSCGRGWRQRQVTCGQVEAGGAVRTLAPSVCGRTTRPTSRLECTSDSCSAWVTSTWGKCSGKCLGPTLTFQKRSVQTHSAGLSESFPLRPPSVRNCSSELCDVHWRVGPWRACTAACGSGFQSRRVDCAHRRSGRTLADHHCTWHRRPATWQHCNATTCGSECRDTTHYCAVVKRLKLCPIHMYKQRCCESCSHEDGTT